jgi:hypothetical protein
MIHRPWANGRVVAMDKKQAFPGTKSENEGQMLSLCTTSGDSTKNRLKLEVEL